MYDTTKPYKGQIVELIKQTHDSPYAFVNEYGNLVFRNNYPKCFHVDGIGTKS